jgi:hypothetical protein
MRLTYYSLACGARYIEVPKCASTSIKLALLESDGLREMFGEYPHACRRWRAVPGYFKPCIMFTFVRHPVDRLLSSWREKLQTGKAKQLGGACPLPPTAAFDEWVSWIVSQRPAGLDKHWRPQSLILRQDGSPGFIGKMESLDNDWHRLVEGYGLPPLSHANASPDRQRHEISMQTLKRIAKFYAEDFTTFGYSVN